MGQEKFPGIPLSAFFPESVFVMVSQSARGGKTGTGRIQKISGKNKWYDRDGKRKLRFKPERDNGRCGLCGGSPDDAEHVG